MIIMIQMVTGTGMPGREFAGGRHFEPDGHIASRSAIEESDLPREVRAALAKDFKGYKISEIQKLERADNKPMLFEVHLENADGIVKLQFEASGTVSSKSVKKKKGP
jgi:hypothetical protein